MGQSDDEKQNSGNEDRRRKILEAASRLIVHYGYDKTTVADIAEEAGISKGAIYLHFDSKDQLFGAAIYYEIERMTEDLLRRIDADPESGSLGSLYSHSLMALAANPLLRALTTRNKRILGNFMQQAAKDFPFADARVFSNEFVQHFQQAGLLRDDLTPDMIVYLLTMIRAGLLTVDDLLPEDWVQSMDAVGTVLPDIMERAFAPPGGGNREVGKQVMARYIDAAREMLKAMRKKL